MTKTNEELLDELTQAIIGSRPLAGEVSAVLDGHDFSNCIAALGIALSMVIVDESDSNRDMARRFFDAALNSSLMMFDEMKRKPQ